MLSYGSYYYPIDKAPEYESPECWDAYYHLETSAIERFVNKVGDVERWAYAEIGFVSKEARGKNILSKLSYYTGKWLNEKYGVRGIFTILTGVFALKALLAYHYKIYERILFSEFEYKGTKPYKDV